MILREWRMYYLGKEVGKKDDDEGKTKEGERLKENDHVKQGIKDDWHQD